MVLDTMMNDIEVDKMQLYRTQKKRQCYHDRKDNKISPCDNKPYI